MSLIVGKKNSFLHMRKNKDAEQLRGDREADQRLCFDGALLTAYLYLLYPIATFQKAGTCLDAQQSMAKQPIKGCVSYHSRMCGKSVSEKSE